MKILAIRGENLASLKAPFAIDFETPPLSQLGVLTINGPVGAGKSTILDALCLALFGKTPRLSGRGGAPLTSDKHALRGNDPRTLVRVGAALAFAEVDFRGHDGERYRARWQVRRARDAATGRLLDDEHSLVQLNTQVSCGTTNTEVREAIVAAIGMSYDEFTRGVLLAQGGFAAFLLAKPDERASLLECMTGTEVYGALSQRAFLYAKATLRSLQQVQAEAAGCTPLSLEARRALVDELAHLTEQATAAQHATEQAAHDAQDAHRRNEQRARFVAAHAAWVTANHALDEINARANVELPQLLASAQQLQTAQTLAHERATLLAIPTAEAVAQAHAASTASAARLAAHVARGQQLHATASRLRDELAKLFGPLNDAESDALEHVRTDCTLWVACEAHQTTTQNRRSAAEQSIAALREQLSHAEASRRSLHARVPMWLLRPELQQCDPRTREALVGHALQGAATRTLHDVDIEIRVEQRMVQRLEGLLNRQQERRALVQGEPCPLCGALEHPLAHRDALSDESALASARTTLAVLQTRRTALLRAISAGEASVARSAPVERVLSVDWEGSVLESWERLDHALLRQLAEMAGVDERVAQVEMRIAGVLNELDGIAAEEVKLQQERARILAAITARAHGKLAFVLSMLSRTAAQAQALLTDVVAQHARRQNASDALAAAQNALAEHEAQMGALQAAQHEAMQHEARAQQAHDAMTERVHDLHRRIRACCPDADNVASVVASNQAAQHTLTSLRAHAIAQHEHAKAACAALFAMLSHDDAFEAPMPSLSLTLPRLRPIESSAGINDRLLAARHLASGAFARMAEVKARLATDDAAVALHNVVAPRLQAAQAAHERAGALAELMGSADGSKFRVFAQSLTLDVLIGHANAHLAVLQPRYRLLRLNDVRARLEMAVVDGHAGDEVRALSSLSGGETFLMSLALALGLSSLQSQRSVVESLFIDEGFSSLDPDTLEVALAAFEALKLGGRQVTVISHVPALSDRLGAPIRVIPQGAGRSRVEVG